MNQQKAAQLIIGEKYYSINDLRYNQKVGIMLSKDEFEQFLKDKEALIDGGFECIKTIPLKMCSFQYRRNLMRYDYLKKRGRNCAYEKSGRDCP